MNGLSDSDADGLIDLAENVPASVDTDNDGTPDHLDTDSDNDGISDAVELGRYWDDPIDSNSDGTPDFRDPSNKPGAFIKWRQDHFARKWNSETSAGWLSNPDGDAYCNGLEYALVGNPSARDASLSSLDATTLALHFRRNPAATDATIIVLTSTDMTHWQAAVRSIRGAAFTPLLPGWFSNESAGDGLVQVGRTAPASEEPVFLRVSATVEQP